MKPVFIRELKELSPALALILFGAVICGVVFTGPLSREFDDLLVFPIVAGAGLGLAQGLLDRWRRADLFALHRPVPTLRMEAARSLAGVTVLLAGAAALVLAHRVSTVVELADFAWMEGLGFYLPPEHLGANEVALLTAFLLVAWAVTRFSAGAIRAAWALPALGLVPLAAWSLLSHAGSFAAATGGARALAALASLGSVLSIAGDRR